MAIHCRRHWHRRDGFISAADSLVLSATPPKEPPGSLIATVEQAGKPSRAPSASNEFFTISPAERFDRSGGTTDNCQTASGPPSNAATTVSSTIAEQFPTIGRASSCSKTALNRSRNLPENKQIEEAIEHALCWRRARSSTQSCGRP